jgi:uncharacterized protein YydD (DUF2326 family)
MYLTELVVMRASLVVRSITFKSGLNLILDKPAPTATHSGNSVGKTTALRLIDFCLGSEGDDIWQDAEFKSNINQDVYNFLHGPGNVTITLGIEDEARGSHTLLRSFGTEGHSVGRFQIDNTPFRSIKAYRKAVKELLFVYGGEKPSLRQIVPKFVRSSPALMSRTLKFLGDYGTAADYEALHLLLFGFFDVDVLEERPRLTAEKKRLSRDLQALNRLRKEGEIEQLLIHLRREIETIGLSPQLRGEVPGIAERASGVTATRSRAANVAGQLSRYESEIASLLMTIDTLKSEFSDIDRKAIESVYREAQNYIAKLHHDWNDLSDFVQNLRSRKQRYLQTQIADLQRESDKARKELVALQTQERDEIGTLVKSPEFSKALELRADLQEKLKQLGSLEQSLRDLRDTKSKIASVEARLEQTLQQIDQGKALLGERVGVFNEYFSELSKVLYGEQYLLHFDETERGEISFQLTAVGSNVGAGKKASQTAAFDLAYIKFLREAGINFPTFVCHDGVEQIHANQLSALLVEASHLEGQLILATLRDKLPPMPGKFIEENTVLSLAQDDKLFHL